MWHSAGYDFTKLYWTYNKPCGYKHEKYWLLCKGAAVTWEWIFCLTQWFLYLYCTKVVRLQWQCVFLVRLWIAISWCEPMLVFFLISTLWNVRPCYGEGGRTARLRTEAEKKWKIFKASALQVWCILTGCVKILCVSLGCDFGTVPLCTGQILFEMHDGTEISVQPKNPWAQTLLVKRVTCPNQ